MPPSSAASSLAETPVLESGDGVPAPESCWWALEDLSLALALPLEEDDEEVEVEVEVEDDVNDEEPVVVVAAAALVDDEEELLPLPPPAEGVFGAGGGITRKATAKQKMEGRCGGDYDMIYTRMGIPFITITIITRCIGHIYHNW